MQYKFLYTNSYWSLIGRHSKKNFKVSKKGFPLEPRYAGMCMFSIEKLRHWRMQFETPAHTISFFVPGHHPRFETYTNPFPCHIANPITDRWPLKMFLLIQKYACGNTCMWECRHGKTHVGKMGPDVPFVMALNIWCTHVKNSIGYTCIKVYWFHSVNWQGGR